MRLLQFRAGALLLLALSTAGQLPEFRRLPDHRGQSFGLENFLLHPFNLGSQEDLQGRRELLKTSSTTSFRDPYTVEYQVQNHNFDVRKTASQRHPQPPLAYTDIDVPSANMKPVHEEPEDDFPNLPMAPPPPPHPRRRQSSEGSAGRITHKRISPETRRPLERPSEFQVTISEDDPPSTVVVAPPPPSGHPERVRKRVMKRRRKKPVTPPPEIIGDFKPSNYLDGEIKEIRLNQFPGLEENRGQPEINKEERHTHRRRPTIEEQIEQDPHKTVVEQQVLRDSVTPPHHGRRKLPIEPSHDEELVSINNPIENVPDSSVIVEEQVKPQRRKNGNKRVRDPIADTVAHLAAQPDIVRPDEKPEQSQNSEIIGSFPKVVPVANHEEETDYASFTTEASQESTNKLKSLLKQQNGQLSLSEILQTQNFSLSDFLKGNPGALSALGANKINNEKTTTPLPEPEKPKYHSRHQIPKISKHSRPFSKNTHTEEKIRNVQRTTTEEPPPELPKKLDIIEVTSDRPNYNGFVPKNPKTRPPLGIRDSRPTYPPGKIDEEALESVKNIQKAVKDSQEESENSDESLEKQPSSTRSPVYRLTTPVKDTTISDQRVVPSKRFGEYRPKFRIDRRKQTTEIPETTLGTESSETTLFKQMEEGKPVPSQKNRVRIPFQSVNNPEISVIVSRKVNVTSTEKPRDRLALGMRDRINLFKRLNQEDRSRENSNESKMSESSEATSSSTSSTTTTTTTAIPTTTVDTTPADTSEEYIRTTTTETRQTTVDDDIPEVFNESSDEIVELLKTGSNAQRLQRILQARNMTVGELLEKRASSSKQPNVTHQFKNQTTSQLSSIGKVIQLDDNHHPGKDEPEKVSTTVRPIRPKIEIPKFKQEPSERIKIKNDEPKHQLESNSFDELFVDESVIRPIKINFEESEGREPKAIEKQEKNQKAGHRIHLNLSPGTEGKAKHPVPLWNVDEKSIYNSNPYGYPTYDLNKNLAGPKQKQESSSRADEESETLIVETTRKNDGSNNNLHSHINEILKEQAEVVKEIRTEEKTFIPPAVKSAIIASGVVMGIALIVFVAIFAACGWKQRQFRLRARSSILNDSLNGSGHKVIKRTGTLSPISFKRSSLYKKTIEFEDSDSSISGSSNTSSYLWNTLKHTFQSRNSTLKNRQEKEEKIQERENRSRRNTLSRDEDRPRNTLTRDDGLRSPRDVDLPRRNTLTRDDFRRESISLAREDIRRESTLHRDDHRRESTMSRGGFARDDNRRDSTMSRDTLTREFPREETRRSSMFRDDTRRLNSLLRENERCSFKKIDPDRNIIQTSVNFKRGGFNGSSRHFDSCDHFN